MCVRVWDVSDVWERARRYLSILHSHSAISIFSGDDLPVATPFSRRVAAASSQIWSGIVSNTEITTSTDDFCNRRRLRHLVTIEDVGDCSCSCACACDGGDNDDNIVKYTDKTSSRIVRNYIESESESESGTSNLNMRAADEDIVETEKSISKPLPSYLVYSIAPKF